MTKLDLNVITDKDVKTNLYLFLAGRSAPIEGVSYIPREDMKSAAAIARYVADVADYRTVNKSLYRLQDSGHLYKDSVSGDWIIDEKFDKMFVKVDPQKANEMCQTWDNESNTLILYIYDKIRYYKGQFITTQGRLAKEALGFVDNSQNRKRVKDRLDDMMANGRLKWCRIKDLTTYRVKVWDVHL